MYFMTLTVTFIAHFPNHFAQLTTSVQYRFALAGNASVSQSVSVSDSERQSRFFRPFGLFYRATRKDVSQEMEGN